MSEVRGENMGVLNTFVIAPRKSQLAVASLVFAFSPFEYYVST